MVKREGRSISLGLAQLKFAETSVLDPSQLGQYNVKMDVIAYSTVEVSCNLKSSFPRKSYSYEATLFFGKLPTGKDYRWFEVSFWSFRGNMSRSPFGIDPIASEFWLAFAPITSSFAVAHGPIAIDAEDEESSRTRWTKMFTKAVGGELVPPTQLPIPDSFFD